MAETTTSIRTVQWAPMADLTELSRLGVLHEVNRLLLHPIGLALGLKFEEGQEPALVMYDQRRDPEGILFTDQVLDAGKVEAFAGLMKAAVERRLQPLGFGIQPVEAAQKQVTLSLRETVEGRGATAEEAEADAVAQ